MEFRRVLFRSARQQEAVEEGLLDFGIERLGIAAALGGRVRGNAGDRLRTDRRGTAVVRPADDGRAAIDVTCQLARPQLVPFLAVFAADSDPPRLVLAPRDLGREIEVGGPLLELAGAAVDFGRPGVAEPGGVGVEVGSLCLVRAGG